MFKNNNDVENKKRKLVKKLEADLVVKLKVIGNGKVPQKKTNGAACFDCYARETVEISCDKAVLIPLGFAMKIPKGWCAKIYPRSSTGLKTKIRLANSVGIIDSDYIGEISYIAELKGETAEPVTINAGDRICQMSFERVPKVIFQIVEVLPETKRGTNGYGSTGRR